MNQLPPENPYRERLEEASGSRADPSPPQGHANPYIGYAQAGPEPDLDAHAPMLRASESQRLNRKALGFLAATISLLVLMAAWVFAGGHESENRRNSRQDGEEVRIPELPQAAASTTAPAAPLQSEGYVPVEAAGLPPLPPSPWTLPILRLRIASRPGVHVRSRSSSGAWKTWIQHSPPPRRAARTPI